MRPIDITKLSIYPYIENIINKFKKNDQIEPMPSSDAVNENIDAKFREEKRVTVTLGDHRTGGSSFHTYIMCNHCYSIFEIGRVNDDDFASLIVDNTWSCEKCKEDLLCDIYKDKEVKINLDVLKVDFEIINESTVIDNTNTIQILFFYPKNKFPPPINMSGLMGIYYKANSMTAIKDCYKILMQAFLVTLSNGAKKCVFCLEDTNKINYQCNNENCLFVICDICNIKLKNLIFKKNETNYQRFLNYFKCKDCDDKFYCPFHISNCIGNFLNIDRICSDSYCTVCMQKKLNKENGFIQCAGEKNTDYSLNNANQIYCCNALFCEDCASEYTLDIHDETKCVLSHLLKYGDEKYCHFQFIVYSLFVYRYIIIGPFIDIIDNSQLIVDFIKIIKSISNDNEIDEINKTDENTIKNNITVHANSNRIINLLKQILTSINKSK